MTNKRISRASPMHIVLLADDSGSMKAAPPGQTRSAAALASVGIREWVASLQAKTQFKKPYFFFTLIVFDDNAEIISQAADVNSLNLDTFDLKGKPRARTALH